MKHLPLAVRFLLLPITSIIDVIAMPKNVDEEFYDKARYFVGGFHVVCWLRLMFIPILLLIVTFLETCIREAALIANRLYQKQQSFDSKQILDSWDKGSFTYDCLLFEVYLFVFLSWLILVSVVRKSLCFVPMQWIGLFTMSRFVYYTIHDQYVRIQNELHILRNMHEIKRDLRSLRTRAFEFPVMPVPYEFAPLVRAGTEFVIIFLMFVVVYVIERAMLFYGYEKLLCGLYNRIFGKEKRPTAKSPNITIEMEALNSL